MSLYLRIHFYIMCMVVVAFAQLQEVTFRTPSAVDFLYAAAQYGQLKMHCLGLFGGTCHTS